MSSPKEEENRVVVLQQSTLNAEKNKTEENLDERPSTKIAAGTTQATSSETNKGNMESEEHQNPTVSQEPVHADLRPENLYSILQSLTPNMTSNASNCTPSEPARLGIEQKPKDGHQTKQPTDTGQFRCTFQKEPNMTFFDLPYNPMPSAPIPRPPGYEHLRIEQEQRDGPQMQMKTPVDYPIDSTLFERLVQFNLIVFKRAIATDYLALDALLRQNKPVDNIMVNSYLDLTSYIEKTKNNRAEPTVTENQLMAIRKTTLIAATEARSKCPPFLTINPNFLKLPTVPLGLETQSHSQLKHAHDFLSEYRAKDAINAAKKTASKQQPAPAHRQSARLAYKKNKPTTQKFDELVTKLERAEAERSAGLSSRLLARGTEPAIKQLHKNDNSPYDNQLSGRRHIPTSSHEEDDEEEEDEKDDEERIGETACAGKKDDEQKIDQDEYVVVKITEGRLKEKVRDKENAPPFIPTTVACEGDNTLRIDKSSLSKTSSGSDWEYSDGSQDSSDRGSPSPPLLTTRDDDDEEEKGDEVGSDPLSRSPSPPLLKNKKEKKKLVIHQHDHSHHRSVVLTMRTRSVSRRQHSKAIKSSGRNSSQLPSLSERSSADEQPNMTKLGGQRSGGLSTRASRMPRRQGLSNVVDQRGIKVVRPPRGPRGTCYSRVAAAPLPAVATRPTPTTPDCANICPFCEQFFSRRDNLLKHLKNVHRVNAKGEPIDAAEQWICRKCTPPREFFARPYLQEHDKKYHANKGAQYFCNYCKKVFATKSLRSQHEKRCKIKHSNRQTSAGAET